MIEGYEEAQNSHDNIIIWGSTLNKLNFHTENVLGKIRKCGLELNKEKYIFDFTQ